ncbi:MAG: regulatory iron-sulfur-containing complex subunit RicT [Candidatus Zixiibacteriota bacterium]
MSDTVETVAPQPAPEPAPAVPQPVYMVEFKGARKEFYRDEYHLPIKVGSPVIVQVERGEDLGRVIQHLSAGDAKRARVKPLPILRVSTAAELEHEKKNRQDEFEARQTCRRMVEERRLEMKVVDAEWQFDRNKMTFYFTADKRVDFRALVKDLAGLFKTRIELRQIGARDEARRVGGVGVCGYEQCCTMFLKEFEPITTQMARDQNLSLNPAKISGNCGRLLCCLRYESGYYREASRLYPEAGLPWETDEGPGTVEGAHILREQVFVRLADGRQAKVPLAEFRRRERKKTSWFE